MQILRSSSIRSYRGRAIWVSGRNARTMSVPMYPGETVFTVMPFVACSLLGQPPLASRRIRPAAHHDSESVPVQTLAARWITSGPGRDDPRVPSSQL